MSNASDLQEQVDDLRKIIADSSSEDKTRFEAAYNQIKGLMMAHGDIGIIAVSVIGAELALQAEKEGW
jgi:hypothetical protein